MSTVNSSASTTIATNGRNDPVLWEWPGPAVQAWLTKTLQPMAKSSDSKAATFSPALWAQHVSTALAQLRLEERPDEQMAQEDDDEQDDEMAAPKKKRARRPKAIPQVLLDPFHIWLLHLPGVTTEGATERPWLQDDWDDLPATAGGRLAQLSVGGLMNALAGVPGGVLSKPHPGPTAVAQATAKQAHNNNNVPVQVLFETAVALHRAIQAVVQHDILRTTPTRIQQMLAPDLDASAIEAIRRRIVETVLEGKGLHTDDWQEDLPTGHTGASHDIEKSKKCQTCGNNDQSSFVLDRKNGDVICSNCGTVVSESIMHEGSQFRKFEGEVDRNHHGDTANPLYSNAHNLGTSLSAMPPKSGIAGTGAGSASSKMLNILKNAHAYTELNVSQFGKTDRRTRMGYKDRQKKEAFLQMTHTGDALNLHEAVVQRAKELFAGFRDDRELVQQFKGVLAACLCEAFEQLSQNAGQLLLKQHQQQDAAQQRQAAEAAEAAAASSSNNPTGSSRAARRNELHQATLAGKGGLLLDFSVRDDHAKDQSSAAAATALTSHTKPAAQWDLEDARSWLLEASRKIAQQWAASREAGQADAPAGPKEELEGRLVEHSIALCEYLEGQVKASQKRNGMSSSSSASKRKVVTPRVTDMSKLGIQWQHGHERGSGGKGGVGGSGKAVQQQQVGRTAGQVLQLLTAKKLGSILKDDQAGQAIHKELRGLIGQQQARKRQELLQEATRQRLNQMKRKPWLQARADQVT